jgi:hypothetical protein
MRGVRLAIVLALTLALTLALVGCGDRSSSAVVASQSLAAPSGEARDGRVVLVTVDGARWQDVFHGSDPALGGTPHLPPEALMPRTHALVAARGVGLGADLPGCPTVHTATASNVSLPGYLSIFTGHPSDCLDNGCERAEATVLDETARVKNGGAGSIGSWKTLGKAVSGGASGVFVATGRDWPEGSPKSDHLAELVAASQQIGPFPANEGYRPDTQTAAIALEYFRIAAPTVFHIGLGDTDEYGHRGDYAGYLAALHLADDVVGAIADVLDTMGPRGDETTVIVTPDHGRSAAFRDHGLFYPESGRTFMLAFGGGVPVSGIVCPSREITLADIAPTVRVLIGLPPDTAEGAGHAITDITGPL